MSTRSASIPAGSGARPYSASTAKTISRTAASSPTRASRSSGTLIRSRSGSGGLVVLGDEARGGDTGQLPHSAQELEIDQEPGSDHQGPQLAQEMNGGRGGPPGGDQVVHEKDAGARSHGVGVNLENALPVFERVFRLE